MQKSTLALLASTLATLPACPADDDPSATTDADSTGDDATADPTADTSAGDTESSTAEIYAMMTQVYSVDDRTVYLILTNGLDFANLSVDNGREFPGVANMAAINDKLLVSSGQEPSITEFDISDDLQWTEERTLSFANYPLDDNANFYYQFLVDSDTIYLPFDKTSRIIWNPADFTITGTAEDTNLVLEKDGLMLDPSGNRNAVRFDGHVFQAFFYHDTDWFLHGTDSAIAVYDPETNAEIQVIDAECPGLSIATQDEDGNVYFSAWSYSGLLALYGDAAAPCAVRVRPDLTIDDSFTTDFTDWTDGRYVANFRYIGGGKAIGNVLMHEELEAIGADFAGDYQPDIGDVLWTSGPHWKLWVFDVEAKTAQPLANVGVEVASIAQFSTFDDRTFVFLPYDDAASSKIYEVDLEAATATEQADVTGDVYAWIRVR